MKKLKSDKQVVLGFFKSLDRENDNAQYLNETLRKDLDLLREKCNAMKEKMTVS